MKIDDKVDAVYIPDSPSRIKATDYNQIKNEIQECITLAGMTPQKDVIQLPDALKILTAQSGAEEMEKISAAGENQISIIESTGNAQAEYVNAQGSEYADLAKAWASKTDGPVEDEEYSSKKYAQDAAVSAANSRGLAVGTVYYSQFSTATQNPGALPLFTGETISNAQEIYPDFYALIAANAGLKCTSAQYEADLTTYGECAKYVLNNGSMRLPLIKNYIKAANTTEGIKNIAAGLPNITGKTFTIDSVAGRISSNVTPPFYEGPSRAGALGSTIGTGRGQDFDLSKANSLYGKSSTVTPASTTLYPWVVAFNAAVPASTAQAAAFQQAVSDVQQELNEKADKNTVTNYLMPDYSKGITLPAPVNAPTTYTAPSDGFVVLGMSTNSDGLAEISVNGVRVSYMAASSNALFGNTVSLLVSKNDVIKYNVVYGGWYQMATFFPLKGVN